LEIPSKSPGPLPLFFLLAHVGPCSVLLCRRQCFPSGRRCAGYRRPPPASSSSTRRLLPLPVLLLSPGGLPRAPRLPRASAGRHLLVAVESSPKRLNSLSLTRNSITLTPTFYSFSSSAKFSNTRPHSIAAVFS
jgi:hypothetical protein